MSYTPPPPPPAPAAPSGSSWWRTPTALFLIGILIAAAIAVPIVLIMLGGDDEPVAGSSTTTTRATSTTGGTSTTAGTTTSSSTTTAGSTTSSSTSTSTSSSTTTSTSTTTTTTTTTPLALNFSLPPNYGSTDLASGFVPDPFSMGMTSGGPVDVTYLGAGCLGFATSAPDLSVNYTAGAFPLLRFYFVGAGDTALVVNSPSGSYFCSDDSYGTDDPTVDFNSPTSGRYDIWVASYNTGEGVTGTFYVTENAGNHP